MTSVKRFCKACGDRAWKLPEKGWTEDGRDSADYCMTCFLELARGRIRGPGNISFFDASGLEHLAEGQRLKRGHSEG